MATRSDSEISLLIATARSWVGTPFCAHQAVRGVGVDCVHLAAEIYLRMGWIREFCPPEYSLDGGQHRDRSQILEYLTTQGEFTPILIDDEGKQLRPGDLVIMRYGRVEHHVGVVTLPPVFVHALQGYGVMESRLDDPTYKHRITAVYRPQ